MRIDNELVVRGLFDTRNRAQNAIKEGKVKCNNKIITKPSYDVCEEDFLEIEGDVMPYVSRGGLKLEKAIKCFNVNLTDKIMLDIGSSTGGFTDCALKNNVKKVIAVDVGTDQMAKSLRDNPKLELYENTDFRNLDSSIINEANIATIDVSFISVTKIIDGFTTLNNLKEVVCLIKPQFECGMQIASRYKGIVNDKNVHKKVIEEVISAFYKIGYKIENLSYSPITGGSGNIEYLGYFIKTNTACDNDSNTENINSDNNKIVIDSKVITSIIEEAFMINKVK